jgi:hypothetical protein
MIETALIITARPTGRLTRARPKVSSLIISSADEQEQDGKVQEEMPVIDSTSRLSRNRTKSTMFISFESLTCVYVSFYTTCFLGTHWFGHSCF